MPRTVSASKRELLVTSPARRDIVAIVRWTFERFGEAGTLRYEALIAQAFRDLQEDPTRPGSSERPELMIPGVRTYHLSLSRTHVAGDRVKDPRHFVLYRSGPQGSIEIARILHDSRDLARHVPNAYKLPEPDPA